VGVTQGVFVNSIASARLIRDARWHENITNKGSVETRSQENLRSNSTTNPGARIPLKDCTLKYLGRLKEFFYHFDSPKNQLIFTVR